VLRDVRGIEQLERKPLLAVLEWTQSFFADEPDVPVFTLFDDGFVVAKRRQGGRPLIVEATLPASERDALVRDALAADFLQAPTTSRGPVFMTHSPSTTILLRHDGRWKSATVEGFYNGAMLAGETHQPPAMFAAAYARAIGTPLPGAVPWRPRAFKVTLQEADSVDGETAPWPADLPQPGDLTFPIGDGAHVYYVVDGAHERAVRLLAAKRLGARYAWRGKAWSIFGAVPTIAAWTYLERVRFCTGELKGPEDCYRR